ncbi:MAG: hypothetical protein K9M45_04555 [Kiritimatiellales bacterium]|nr:hypothetical protein [Kiritimatiellales bacterium]
MIKLFSKRILVDTANGEHAAFDMEELGKDLAASFVRAGVHETGLAEHFLGTIEDQIQEIHALSNSPVEAQDIEMLLSRLLADAGFPDVAAMFCQRRNIHPQGAAPCKTKEWTHERVAAVLGRTLVISPTACEQLTAEVVNRLRALDFQKVADELITSIGQHILTTSARDHRQPPEDTEGWLMPPGYWTGLFSAEIAALIQSEVLTFHPVSQLFPVVRATLNLDKLADSCGQTPLTELAFFPRLKQQAHHAVQAIVQAQEHTSAAHTSDAQRPAYLRIMGLQSLIQDHFEELRHAVAGRLQEEVIDTIANEAAATGTPKVILSVVA